MGVSGSGLVGWSVSIGVSVGLSVVVAVVAGSVGSGLEMVL